MRATLGCGRWGSRFSHGSMINDRSPAVAPWRISIYNMHAHVCVCVCVLILVYEYIYIYETVLERSIYRTLNASARAINNTTWVLLVRDGFIDHLAVAIVRKGNLRGRDTAGQCSLWSMNCVHAIYNDNAFLHYKVVTQPSTCKVYTVIITFYILLFFTFEGVHIYSTLYHERIIVKCYSTTAVLTYYAWNGFCTYLKEYLPDISRFYVLLLLLIWIDTDFFTLTTI